ncbi:putative phosphoglycerate mutase [Streptomyces sp. Amel2xB2]|uniref:bifunctional RNase H/acid phosphatase n=1 Tax=Streptomyces sp. Amel2xB2 TaxID=1305829 RepID=UPI000DBFF13A|nr:bifunctional RNase H/acid phosphatase [Streptomyces sp. Amel2xB2]RAJ70364.1 putative phosphoglycerate mutase [Streptomyces sp. Amel2xB2]
MAAGRGGTGRGFVIEADGGSRGNPGPAGYGAVVRDAASGEVLRETAEFIGVATNNVAEYRGLIAGLRAAHELDPHASVHVRMDSKLVVEQMSGRWKIKHPDMRPLAAEAQRVFPPGSVTGYEWIPRAENKHADRLANEAMDAGRRGEQWSAAASTAELEAADERARAQARSETSGAALPRTAVSGRVREPAPAEPSAAADPVVPAPAAPAGDDAAETSAPQSGWGPDLGPPTTFVLLRHGETRLTPEKRFSGSGGTDPELSAAGWQQAHAAAELMAARGTLQGIVTSPMRRCRQTASAVAERTGLEVHVDEGLREADFGAWEGLTFAEVRERHPEDLERWLESTEVRPTGGGESFATVAERVAVARDRLLKQWAGRTVLLVTHVTPVKTFVRLALEAPPAALFRMELSAACLSVIAYYADGNASVRLLNDTSHLR